MSLYSRVIKTPLVDVQITYDDEHLHFLTYDINHRQANSPANALSRDVERQLLAYCKNSLHVFELPLIDAPTAFGQRFREALMSIKPGACLTYGDIAWQLESSARAIGQACRANPIALIVPCHRIVAKNAIGGFAGKTKGDKITLKSRLLAHEGI